MRVSINANRCEPSPMRKFHPYAVEAEQKGRKIYHLNIGQPDLKTPEAYYAAIRQFHEGTLAYAESPGIPILIDQIREYYARLGVQLDQGDVLVTTRRRSPACSPACLSLIRIPRSSFLSLIIPTTPPSSMRREV